MNLQDWFSRRWSAPFIQDARFTRRSWLRNPAFSVAALALLALGLGAATALFSVCDRILFRSLPYSGAERFVSVGLVAPLDSNEFLLGPDYAQLWHDTPAPFVAVTTQTAGTSPCDLTEARPERLTCASVKANLLNVLGLPLQPVVISGPRKMYRELRV
jgi:putative ABC transport system permease protein